MGVLLSVTVDGVGLFVDYSTPLQPKAVFASSSLRPTKEVIFSL